MASTYVNDLRLNEMATGDGSGTWGTTTNTNLELIGQAFGYGTRAIADASTDNITIADGASDADRSMYLKLTGGGQACTVTLLPNTTSKVWIMENVTSYTVAFTCGSGANVSILAGETKIIATDGLGSGGVVYDVLTDMNLAGTTKTAALTNAGALSNQGTVTVGVDDTGYDVKLFGATSGNYLLWDESADSLIVTGTTTLIGTTNLDATDIDGNVQIDGTVTVGVDDTGQDVKFFGATSGKSLLWDESADSLIVTGTLTQTSAAAGISTTVSSTEGGTAIGPIIDIHRNSASPADADFIGAVYFSGEDDGDNITIFSSLEAQIDDVTGGEEDGSLLVKTMVGGTLTTIMDISSGGILFSAPAAPNSNDNATLGASGTAWSDLFLASGGVVNWNSGDVTITHSTNTLAFAGATGGYTFDDDLVMASGKGVDFSATADANAGMTSEIFSDYEEGVYTATIVCATSGSYTLNSSYDTLSYTKVGNIVKVQGLIAVSGESSPSGALRLLCPTTAASQTELSGRTQSSCIWEGQGATWAGQTYMVVNAGNAFATFYYQSDSGGETAIDEGEVDTSFNIMVNFWYTSA